MKKLRKLGKGKFEEIGETPYQKPQAKTPSKNTRFYNKGFLKTNGLLAKRFLDKKGLDMAY